MAQKDATMRQMQIIRYLRINPLTFDDIQYKLQDDSEIYDMDLNLSKRTFQRDIKEIYTIYGVEIKHNKFKGYYEIVSNVIDDKTERIIESFNIINTLNATEQISKYIIFENRKADGSHYILDIVTAIKNLKVLEVHHQKYWEKEKTVRKLEPLAVKEYRHRWYLVATDCKDGVIKTFGLDRITEVHQTRDSFEYPQDFDKDLYFKDYYGMIYSDNAPEDVELSFTSLQGKYIKSQPLHHSQKELVDNEKEYRISLKLIPTEYDFMRDLLQFGSSVKVVKPQWLADKIVSMHKEAIIVLGAS